MNVHRMQWNLLGVILHVYTQVIQTFHLEYIEHATDAYLLFCVRQTFSPTSYERLYTKEVDNAHQFEKSHTCVCYIHYNFKQELEKKHWGRAAKITSSIPRFQEKIKEIWFHQWQKPLNPQKNPKSNVTTQEHQQNFDYTQWLRTD